MEFEVSAELVAIYLEDAREQIASLDSALLKLEREGESAEVAASVLGPLHTLKGNSGMIGFAGIKDYVHRLEKSSRARAKVRSRSTLTCSTGSSKPPPRCARPSGSAVATGREQQDLSAPQQALAALLASGPGPAKSLAPAAASGAKTPEAAPLTPARSSTVRVDFAKLDQLLNLVVELIVHRTKLDELARPLADAVPGTGPELLAAVHQVASVSTAWPRMTGPAGGA